MSRSGAFTGLQLSTGLSPAGLDQRLFAASPGDIQSGPVVSPPLPRPSSASSHETNPTKKDLPRSHPGDVRSSAGDPTAAGASRWLGLAFDISVKPYRKDSFLFTDEEFEALEDLKLELRRTHDLPATKNDIVRAALHAALEDYARERGSSRIALAAASKRT